MSICVIDDCDNKIHSRSWCSKHYHRNWKHGSPHIVIKQVKKPKPVKVKKIPSYDGLHKRLSRTYGSAKLHDCAVCFEPADEWALIKELVPEGEMLYGKTSRGLVAPYSLDAAHYFTLCRSDHATLDKGAGIRAGLDVSMS